MSIFKRRDFFKGEEFKNKYRDIVWYNHDANEFTAFDWKNEFKKSVSYMIYDNIENEHYFFIYNANYIDWNWVLPDMKNKKFTLLLDSSEKLEGKEFTSLESIFVPSWSVLVFKVK